MLALVVVVHGHGAMVHPRSRNSIDWEEVPDDPHRGIHNTGAHICSNLTGAACNNGQSQYWYSQGCFIGCDEVLAQTRKHVHCGPHHADPRAT